MKKYLILLFAAFALTFTSCEKGTDPGATATQDMSGEWWVTATYKNSAGATRKYGPFEMYTYNTAANTPKEMWLDDQGNFWLYKIKVNLDYTNKLFTANAAANTAIYKGAVYDITMNVTEGKVLKNAAKTPSGMPADSISYTIEFSDDPGTLYHIGGFRRTGFPEDDF
ncbi:MAG: lipid-binding protein [Paludibacteraceae bacterium]